MTSSDRPRAASQAANTSRIIGIMLERVRWVLRIITVAITKMDSIMPSKHKSEDIRWDRYSNRPSSDTVKARMVFI